MPVVSVINYKGGVGKTTVTANVGAELAYRGKKVLLVDMDAQSSLTFSFIQPDIWRSKLSDGNTILKWYQSFSTGTPLALDDMIIPASKTGQLVSRRGGRLDLIPSHLGLINMDLELATELGGASLKQAKQNYLKVHTRLAQGLQAPRFADYDLILIDCPPNFNVVTKTAIIASDYLLVPAKADYLSTLGIDYLKRSLDELVRDYNDFADADTGDAKTSTIDPQILGVVFTMLQFYGGQPISTQRPYIAQVKKLGLPVLDSYTRESKRLFAEAPEYGVPVTLNGSSGAANVVGELEDLAADVAARIGI